MFIGAIVGAISAGISTVISAVSTFIGGAAVKVGSAISGVASGFISEVLRMPRMSIDVFKTVIDIASKIIHSICEILDTGSKDDAVTLGAKAEQAEKSISDFGNDVEKYVKYLNDEITLDKAKFEKMTDEQKMGCKAIGMALETKLVEEKLGGVKISPEYLSALTKIQMSSETFFSNKSILEVMKSLKEEGITDMNDVVDYLEGKGSSDRVKTGKIIKEALSKMDEIEDVDKAVEDMKQAVRNKEEV